MTNSQLNCDCPSGSYGKKHTKECYEATIERLERENARLQQELQGVRLGAEGMGWAPRDAAEPDEQCPDTPLGRAFSTDNAARAIVNDAMLKIGAEPCDSPAIDEGKLWSFLRDVMTTGCAIETDTRARGRRYEEHSARLDAAARDAIPQFAQRVLGQKSEGAQPDLWTCDECAGPPRPYEEVQCILGKCKPVRTNEKR